MMYAMKYSKENYPTVEDACDGIVWDMFSDYVPHYLGDYLDCHRFVTGSLLDVEIVEANDCFIFLSDEDFEDIRPY